MALNVDPLSRTNSPANPGTTTQKGYVSPLKDQDESLKKDRSYRRYAAGVDRALGLFETTLQEWADYISFLGRLQKALQAHSEDIRVIPYKAIVSRRLAQCMNPSLPSGVHQKALEVYDLVFTILGEDALGRELLIWFPGLASTLSFGSLSVRPLFLSLVQDHLVKIPVSSLRPVLKAVILALLPGLEEETSEDFDKSLTLLTQFRRKFEGTTTPSGPQGKQEGAAYFWQCLFLTSITSPSRRIGVLAYLNKCLPKLGQDPPAVDESTKITIVAITTPEPGLLLRCFATGLADEQLLVQRSFLDLLVTHVSLNAPQLRGNAVQEDLLLLVTSALGVVLRRDMSLNRRLWSWFLGPEPASPTDDGIRPELNGKSDGPGSSYFSCYGAFLVTESLLRMISQPSNSPPVKAKPFRIALSLMDRWEVGGSVIPAVFVPLMRSVKDFEATSASHEAFDEVFRSANVFFDGVESILIWAEIYRLLKVQHAKSDDSDALAVSELVLFIVTRFNIREEEMLSLHIPFLILVLVNLISNTENSRGSNIGEDDLPSRAAYLENTIRILQVLVDVLPELKTPRGQKQNGNRLDRVEKHTAVEKIGNFYNQSCEAVDLPQLPFNPLIVVGVALRELCYLTSECIKTTASGARLRQLVHLLCTLARKFADHDCLKSAKFGETLLDRLSTVRDNSSGEERHMAVPFTITSSLTSLVVFLHTSSQDSSLIEPEQFGVIVSILVKHLWAHITPDTPQMHVEATNCILQLHSAISPISHVTSAITTLMTRQDSSGETFLPGKDAIQRFSILWIHVVAKPGANNMAMQGQMDSSMDGLLGRPLDLVIDVLSQPSGEGFETAREWLHSQTSISRILLSVIIPVETMVGAYLESNPLDSNKAALCDWQLRRASYLLSAQSAEQWRLFPQITLGRNSQETLQGLLASTCTRILLAGYGDEPDIHRASNSLIFTSTDILSLLLSSAAPSPLLDSNIDDFLVMRLNSALHHDERRLQGRLIDCLTLSLKSRISQIARSQQKHEDRRGSKDIGGSIRASLSESRLKESLPKPSPAPKELLSCLLEGIAKVKEPRILQKWIDLFCDTLPLWSDVIFQVVLDIIGCFVKRIQAEFESLQEAYTAQEPEDVSCSDSDILQLWNGLEYCIASAHDRLLQDEQHAPPTKSPEISQGFFSNMVSSSAPTESNQLRNAIANNRLTVILCFQDITRLAFSIWSWDRASAKTSFPIDINSGSFKYTVMKLRNRCRKILEHLVAAEPLEMIETLVDVWVVAIHELDDRARVSVINLLHTLEGTRPRNAMPALFNASYSRSNPNALDPTRKSSLTTKVTDADLLNFLIVYGRSLEDDVLEEIWSDCMTFLRDILSNPMPHRAILPRLLEFVSVLSGKMENTNFGEEWKMRRELGDLFTRLLTAIFTIKPPGFSQEAGGQNGPDDVVRILGQTFPALVALLGDTDRLASAISGISTNIIGPVFKARAFPENVSQDLLSLLLKMSKVPNAAKIWRRDVLEAFNDPRIFQSSSDLLSSSWLPLFRQLVLADRDCLTEVLSRIVAPTTAGIMFGVGATAARLDADKKTQINLRRIAALLVCAEEDTFSGHYAPLLARLDELLTATPITSPSSATRPEIMMVYRAMILKSSSIQLAGLWPSLTGELYEAFSSLLSDPSPDDETNKYTPFSLIQAAKLLDILLLIRPDDFQFQEWLFVTNTMDAIYPQAMVLAQQPTARPLADDVGLSLQSLPLPKQQSSNVLPTPTTIATQSPHASQAPFLASPITRDPQVTSSLLSVLSSILRPFFSQLSIHSMESTYALGRPDIEMAKADLIKDLYTSGSN